MRIAIAPSYTTALAAFTRIAFRAPASFEGMRFDGNCCKFGRQSMSPRSGAVLYATSSSSTSASFFEPPAPPESNGLSIYSDILIPSPTSNAIERNNDEHAVMIVTGASRGIGREMVKRLLERTKGKVVACCRNSDDFEVSADEEVFKHRLYVMQLDLEKQDQIDALAEEIKSKFNRVDGLFNVAGLLGDGGKTTSGPERSLAAIERSWFEKTMAINVIGPVLLTQALSSMMRSKQRGRQRKTDDDGGLSHTVPHERPQTIVTNISARVGSISDNRLGGWYSYRISKAALNQATRTMAHELKRQGTLAVALHPGTTDTDLSQPFSKNVKKGSLFPVYFTVDQILDIVDALEDKHSGGLFDWAGKAIPF